MLVSVIIPYFKNKKFISKTIKSVVDQTYKKLEIIIIYDDENHNDLNFIRSFKLKDKRIKIIKNKKNLGAGLSRNVGIQNSVGEYICFIDSDDLWNRNKIKKQLFFMKKANIDISHTSYSIINERGAKLSIRKARDLKYEDLIDSCDIGLSTVMIKSNILNKKDLFPNLKTKEDYVLWLKLTKKGKKFFAIKDELTSWRNTKNSLSSSLIQKLIDAFKVYNQFEKNNFFVSILRVFNLSFKYLNKRFS